jgi:Reverse transcriptase (RNA-dependent DNA polymerase)
MEFPEGYETQCVLLLRALYGLVQTACQWYKNITSIFGKLDFQTSPADPCLYIKKAKDHEPPAYIILYLEDGVIFGLPKIIEQVMKSISSVLKFKDLGEVKNFVGCRLVHSTDGKNIHIFQPKLIKNLEDSFSQYINTNRKFQTPGAPKTVVMRPEKGDNVLSPKDQTKYRLGVGMLLYLVKHLVKHSRPAISNAVRELNKVLDGATNAHWKSLIHTIKFVLDTQLYALRLSPFTRNGSLFLHGYSDSEFVGDRDTHKSVFGFITFLCGAPISWKSKACHSVTLSSTEVEYYAGSETAKEMLFIKSILETPGEKDKLHLPMLLCMDNTGAIYLSNGHLFIKRSSCWIKNQTY